jgi:O-antigen/teichoic acid export membrane protein
VSIRTRLSSAPAAAWITGEKWAAGRSIVGNGGRLMGLQWIETALNTLYFAIMARWLGPALFGHWAYGVAACVLIIGLLGFGLDPLVMLRVGRDRSGAGDFVGLMLTLRLVLLGLGALVLAAYALLGEPDPLGRLVLLLLVPALIGRGVALSIRVCFLAYERMADYAKFVALFRGTEAACGILWLLAGGGLIGVVLLHALCWVGEAGFGVSRIHFRLTHITLRCAWRPAKQTLAEGAVLGLSAAAYTVLASGPIMILRHTAVGMPALGQFAIVQSLTMILAGSAQTFFTAALPVLSRSAPEPDVGIAYGRIAASVIAAGAALAAAVGWMIGSPVAQWALGARYAEAGALLAPFVVIGGLILVPAGYTQTLLVSGRRWPIALPDLAAALCLVAALAPAVMVWGLDGAVLATAGAWFLRATMLIACAEARDTRAVGRATVTVARRHTLAGSDPL